jgi:hypothetical protein
MKNIFILLFAVSSTASAAEVCKVFSGLTVSGGYGSALCTLESDNQKVVVSRPNLSPSEASELGRLSVIKALTEQGYVLNGDGYTMIKK